MATLTVTFSNDFSTDLLFDIDVIEFANTLIFATEAIFSNSQFDNLAILDTVQINGNSAGSGIVVIGGSVNASLWSFGSWEPGNTIELTGSSAADNLTGSLQSDFLRGASGRDRLTGGEGNDLIRGGNGRDIISGGGGVDQLFGGNQDDIFIYGIDFELSSGEIIDGGAGTGDKISIETTALGTVGFLSTTIANVEVIEFRVNAHATFNAEIFGAGGVSKVIMGPGLGILDVAGSTVDLSEVEITGVDPANLSKKVLIIGTAADDTITGSAVADEINASGGNDTVDGGGGDDSITLGLGHDAITGGDGNDTFVYNDPSETDVSDSIDGGAGDGDALRLNVSAADVTYDISRLVLSGVESLLIDDPFATATLVTVILSEFQIDSGNIRQMTLDAVSRLKFEGGEIDISEITFDGTAVADTSVFLTGIAGSDVLTGGILNDIITGGSSLDILVGNGGDDTFRYNSGTEIVAGEFIDGGLDIDTIELSRMFTGTADLTGVTINSVERLALLGAGQTAIVSADQIADVSEVQGSAGVQRLQITATALDLSALGFLSWSRFDAVVLNGTDLVDTIIGSSENDTITGGLERDELTGGDGSDKFVYSSLDDSLTGATRDRINDFVQDEDTIAIEVAGFTFIGVDAFSASGAAEINYEQAGAATTINLDGDGDGVAEAKIVLTGLINLIDTDFILA